MAFVIGACLPATLAANWLAGAWDQNAGGWAGSPVGARLEEIALRWLRELVGLGPEWGAAFVTGATMANFTSLTAGRHAVLAEAGWDVEKDGLFGAPEITVVVGEEVHPTLLKSLGLLGLGRERLIKVPVDDQGRMRADRIPGSRTDPRSSACRPATSTPVRSIRWRRCARKPRRPMTWIHVDGSLRVLGDGMLTGKHRSPGRGHSAGGLRICTDAHKWLNVPYDSGIALIRQPDALKQAMAFDAAYLPMIENREPSQYTPELSRRARGVEVWTALKHLGRQGLEEMIDRNCRQARRFAAGLSAAGYEILNDGRAEPGAGIIRLRRKDTGSHRRDSAGWYLLVRRHRVAGPHGNAYQRLFVVDDRRGCRAVSRGDAAKSRRSHPCIRYRVCGTILRLRGQKMGVIAMAVVTLPPCDLN